MQALADVVGTSKSQIDKLEKGQRRLTEDWMRRLARALQCSPADLLEDDESDSRFVNPKTIDRLVAPARGPRDLPVCGYPLNETEAYFLDMKAAVHEMVERPASLSSVEEAYAVYMADRSMQPKYEPGQLLYVHPYRPARNLDYVVVRLTNNRYVVRRFVSEAAGKVTLTQLNPEKEIEFDRSEVIAVQKIVHADEL